MGDPIKQLIATASRLSCMTTLDSNKQSRYVSLAILFILNGICTLASDLQPWNAPAPRLFNPGGRLMEDNSTQSLKALAPINFMCEGRTISFILLQPSKVLSPIESRLSGISITNMDAQPRKALLPMYCRLDGSAGTFNPEQPSKAPSPIYCMPFGRLISEIILQLLNVLFPIILMEFRKSGDDSCICIQS